MRRVALACFAFACLTLAGRAAPGSGHPSQLRAFVIAVSDFARSPASASLYDPGVATAIDGAATELAGFLSQAYRVTPVVFTTRDATSMSAVRQGLDDYFSNVTAWTVNLVFVLTHGMGSQNLAASPASSRLYLATSDTNKENYRGVSILGSDLLQYFQGLRSGSSVFLFIDACESGAIDSRAVRQQLQQSFTTSTRIMVAGSSWPDQPSYEARFTKALLSLWRQPASATAGCTSGRDAIARRITAEMDKYPLPAGLPEQEAWVLFPLTDAFCLESFAKDWGMVVLYNASPDILGVSVIRASDSVEVARVRLQAGDVTPVRIAQDQYVIAADPAMPAASGGRSVATVDLKGGDPLQYVELQPASPVPESLAVVTQARALATAVVRSREAGAPAEEVARFVNRQEAGLASLVTRIGEFATNATVALSSADADAAAARARSAAATTALTSAEADLTRANARLRRANEMLSTAASAASTQAAAEAATAVQQAQAQVDSRRTEKERTSAELQHSETRLGQARTDAATKTGWTVEVRADVERTRAVGRQSDQERARAERLRDLQRQLVRIAPTEVTERGVVMNLATDGDALPSQQRLDDVVSVSSTLETLRIEVESYLDSEVVGRSRERAAVVARYLRSRLPSARITPRGYGRVPAGWETSASFRSGVQLIFSGLAPRSTTGPVQ